MTDSREPIWAYSMYRQDVPDGYLLVVIGGMHGNELSGANYLNQYVDERIKAREGVIRRFDLRECTDAPLGRMYGIPHSPINMLAIPIFSSIAAKNGQREELGKDNNRQFVHFTDKSTPLGVRHLMVLLRAIRAQREPPEVVVLDYHNGSGRYEHGTGMGWAVYGERVMCDAISRQIPRWKCGSAGTAFREGPRGSLRQYCTDILKVQYLLAEVPASDTVDDTNKQEEYAKLILDEVVKYLVGIVEAKNNSSECLKLQSRTRSSTAYWAPGRRVAWCAPPYRLPRARPMTATTTTTEGRG